MSDEAERSAIAQQIKTIHAAFFGSVAEVALGHRKDDLDVNFFDNTVQAAVTTVTLTDAQTSTMFNINKLFKNHDIGDSFFNVATPSTTTTVYVKKNNPTYESVLINTTDPESNVDTWGTEIRDKLNSTTDSVIDVNVTNLLNAGDAKDMLNALYLWHDLCNDANWEKYITDRGTPVPLKNAEISTTTNINNVENVTYNNGDIQKMDDLLTFANMKSSNVIDRFMVQRMLYVYIRLMQYHIAMRFANAVSTSTDTTITPLKSAAWALPATIIGILERDIKQVTSVIKQVQDITNKGKSEYKSRYDEIGTLHESIDKQKTNIRSQMDRARSEDKYEKKGKSLTVASLVILVAVIMGAILISILPLDRSKRLFGAAAVLGVASIGALILTVVFSKVVVEGFSAWVDETNSDALAASITFDEGNRLFSSEMRNLVLTYLTQCTNLVNAVKSYQILGNVNYTMTKENRYFNDMNKQIYVAGEKIKGTHRASDLVQKQNSAAMHFFITVSIIIGASLLSLTAFEDAPMLRTITYAVAGFFLVLAIVIFVLEHSSYVRTDGDKKYWSQPPNTGVMMAT